METVPVPAQPLWQPDPDQIRTSNLARFRDWLRTNRALDLEDHRALYDWSVRDLEGFWSSIAEFFDVRFATPPERVLQRDADPVRTKWFPGGTLNYAEHLLRFGSSQISGSRTGASVLFCAEPGVPENRVLLTQTELVIRVGKIASALAGLGVKCGDPVAGYLPNRLETLIAFLAAASLGAIWSNCLPDLSSRGVIDRLGQIKPKILFAVSGYQYGGKRYDRAAALAEITASLPTLGHVIVVEEVADERLPDFGPSVLGLRWSGLLEQQQTDGPIRFHPVQFDHPLWILYSSGTTGSPKPIVHGHGGILLEHLKALSLHLDLRPADRFFWFTTAGWMMWNFLVSGLALGATPVLYDGSPKFPNLRALWKLIESEKINYFGTSAPFLLACQKEKIEPRKEFDLRPLRSIGSTGAPLPHDGFRWVYDKVKPNVWLGSVSGGTDVCTAFVLSHPWLPVYSGKLQCRGLGAGIEAWDDFGNPVWNRVGELVLTAPMPCMPVCFWNDLDCSRFRRAYFEHFPGIWRHGDWIEIDPKTGQCVIYGRSDSTLNRGGVRMGTSEFYEVVESIPEILGSLVIDTTGLSRTGQETPGKLLLFVVLPAGVGFDEILIHRIRDRIKTELSPRYLPDAIFPVPEIPQTLNGKKMEVPVKRIFQGIELSNAVGQDAMSNPESLNAFLELAERYGLQS